MLLSIGIILRFYSLYITKTVSNVSRIEEKSMEFNIGFVSLGM